jgi:hypothetical protein
MYRGNASRLIPIVLVLIVVAIAIAALVSLGQAIFGGGQSSQTQPDVGHQALVSTDANRSVRMTVRGPIVADENFHSYQVMVAPAMRTMTTYTGYLDQILSTKQLDNNVNAYEQFVYALDKANMMQGDELTGNKNDIRGVCATGDVYEFEVLQDNSAVKRLWTSTCKGSPGSFKASASQVQTLFLNQIPENKTLLKAVDL